MSIFAQQLYSISLVVCFTTVIVGFVVLMTAVYLATVVVGAAGDWPLSKLPKAVYPLLCYQLG